MNVRLRHIEVFMAIRQGGSLTQAARLLNISQPAASKLLAHAEAQLGFKLFDRIKGRLVPTREANILEPHVARLSADLASVRRLAASLGQYERGHLRVGCTPAIGLGLVPRVVRLIHESSPASFEITTHHNQELISGLRAHELDLAVTFGTGDVPGLEWTQVGTTLLACLSRNQMGDTVRLQDINLDSLILLDGHDQAGAQLEDALHTAGISVDSRLVVNTHYIACSLVGAGCGDAIVDMLTGRAMVGPGMTLSPLDPPIRVPVSVMWRTVEPLSLLHREFIAKLNEEASRSLADAAVDSDSSDATLVVRK